MQVSLSPGLWLPVIRTQPKGDDSVAITIDDAPMPDSLPAMLDALDRFGAKASFFMSGFRAVDHMELVQETHHRGHAIYAHGWDHIRLDKQPRGRLITDFDACENLLAKVRPTPTSYLVRMPYNGGYRKISVHRDIQAWMPGSQIAHWALSTEDHLIPPACADQSDVFRVCDEQAARVVASPHIRGAVVLMHDQAVNDRANGHLKPQSTVTLLECLLTRLAQAGLRAETLKPHAGQSLVSRFFLF